MDDSSLLKRNPVVQHSPNTAASRPDLRTPGGSHLSHLRPRHPPLFPETSLTSPHPNTDLTHLQVHPDHPLSHALPSCHGCATFAITPRRELLATPTHTSQQPGAQGAA